MELVGAEENAVFVEGVGVVVVVVVEDVVIGGVLVAFVVEARKFISKN